MLDPSTVEALLDKRNRIVVDTYIRENPKEAVFLYGALHFDGIFQLLKEQDSRWEIQSLEPLYPYTH
jgi:pheromone shutdown protein TraB